MTRVPAKKVETKPIDTPNGTLPIKNGKKPLAKKDVIEPVKNGETPLLKKEVIEPVNNVEKPTVNKGVVDVAEVVEQKKKNGTSMLRKLVRFSDLLCHIPFKLLTKNIISVFWKDQGGKGG